MTEIIILCVLGSIMTELYTKTKRPKLYAFINTVLGVAGLFIVQLLSGGVLAVNSCNTAFSAVMGIPGAALLYIAGIF